MSYLAIAGVLAILTYSTTAAHGAISIYMPGEEDISDVKAIIEDESVFISIDDVSERLSVTAKKITDEMIGICKDELCILVQLGSVKDARRDADGLLINADLIAQALGSKAEWLISGKVLRFVPEDQVALDTVIKTGDVVPDFVLPSITDGKMVPLSSFRGKRVLLFLWASW